MRVWLAILFALVSSHTAWACSCIIDEDIRTASIEAKDKTAFIALTVGQSIEQFGENRITVSDMRVVDPLGGPLSGTVSVRDFWASTSCVSAPDVGETLLMAIDSHAEFPTFEACDPTPADLIGEFQATGRDRTQWPAQLCGGRETDLSGPDADPAPECDHFRKDGELSAWISERFEHARKTVWDELGYAAPAPEESDPANFERFASVDQLADSYYVFAGFATSARLQPDGSSEVRYTVLDDFGQFFPDTLVLRKDRARLTVRRPHLFLVERATRRVVPNMDRDLEPTFPLVTAFADWTRNRTRHALPLDACLYDCTEAQFDVQKTRDALLASAKDGLPRFWVDHQHPHAESSDTP
jgi:hypothetical protein